MGKKALEGVRVLEYCQMAGGPYCGKLLADLGAEVIKIEEPLTGDKARRRGPYFRDIPHPEGSGLFLYLNTNKLGITLNLEAATGTQIFRELVKEADIVIEDQPPGAMKEMGLGYDDLSSLNPGLIVTSITPFGQTGPYQHYKAYHLNLYHGSGHSTFFYHNPDEDQTAPVVGGGHLGEYDGGLSAAVATLAALWVRHTTGEGQHIDISKQEAMIALERVDVSLCANEPEPGPRPGMVGGLVACRDGYVMVHPQQNHQWRGLLELMGNPEWAQNEAYNDEAARRDHIQEIQPHIEEWFSQQEKEDVYHRGQLLGLPLGPVWTTAEVVAWEQARQRPAPLLGQHNEEVYCQRLGHSPEELARMASAGIV
jgi:crotonobetainyl-CoA:carnitine CoA-transferase CaiB-like acyl-CoA transferase